MQSFNPNALLICVDHWPGRLLSALGHPCILTPTLNQLTGNGVTYTNAYSPTPTCIPARRELYTGVHARTHGDRVFDETRPMPNLPTIAQTFREAGYQAHAVGKLHVYPQRDRIGFDEAILNEEGRHHLGMRADDYELFLADQGYAGQELTHGIGNNDYCTRTWHLPEHCHGTNWTVSEMSRVIHRRDPTRPAFWYMSFDDPHPPLVPLPAYMAMYDRLEIDMPYLGEWAQDWEHLPYALRSRRLQRDLYSAHELRLARQAFYAQCTHIDHQIRLIIGLLREEGILDNTIILFTSDHGDMLGNHGCFDKGLFYEDSAKVPLILVPTADQRRVTHHQRDHRLAALCDVMPTLLDLCGIPIPETVEGLSLVGNERRQTLYGEHWEDDRATRMIHDGRRKLIYYPVGNRFQLFDLQNDPREMHDLSEEAAYSQIRTQLTDLLVENLYGSDLAWLEDGRLAGVPDRSWAPETDRGLGGQRGWRFM